MIATLPMYDWPEVCEATDVWWAGLARHLRGAGFEAPDRLTRSGDPGTQWRRPDLLVSQTCGFPLMHDYRDRLEVLATPVYDVEGCSGASYSSLIVVPADGGASRLEDLAGATAAYNAADSLSGHLAFKCVFAPLSKDGRFFDRLVESGSHRASIQLVCDRKADVAAIDCVSFALARRHHPELAAGLAVIAYGPAAPALPYVTAAGRPAGEIERLKHALSAAAADPALAVPREALFIAGLEFLPPDAYQRVLDLEAECDALGYAALA
ncbi:MAG TPA: PhnD/SsuA/transferrin family substrate-binding protein [Aestuariivirgaceae bacterium]|nr:PhnD/SsuA/transferrin family substrate-binding protein [Aestuariivirgaceae bacterium]